MDMKLGRRVNHDPRSLSYPAPTSATLKPVKYRVYGRVLDQGNVGSCVGNACAHALNSAGLHKVRSKTLKEPDALEIYAEATAVDSWPGTYPGQDTGTDANSAAKVLRDSGRISSWTHAFGLQHVLGALQMQPVLLGLKWHQSMFSPDSKGYVHPDGNIAGGHEVLIRGDDAKGTVLVRNSWSSSWGIKGDFKLTYDDLSSLLADTGDATVLIPKDK